MPIFVGLSWALNAWAACGLALLFRMNMSRAFVRDAAFDPNDPQAYLHRGDECRKEKKYGKAITCYDKAIDMLSQYKADESIEEYYHPAVLNKPLALADAWYGKAVALASIGNFEDAKEAYDQSIKQYLESYPEFPATKIANARHRKAVALQNLAFLALGKVRGGQQEKDRKPKDPEDLRRREAAQKEKRDREFKEALRTYDEALETCEEALRTNPEALDLYADIWIDKALMLEQMGESDKCLDVYNGAIVDEVLKNYPHKLAELYDFRGFARIYQADVSQRAGYEDADKDFDNAKKYAESVGDKTWHAFALWGKGCVLQRKGQPKPAEHSFRKSLNLLEKNPAFIWKDLGDALLDQEDYGEALAAYEKALWYFSDLKNIEIEQAWRGESLALIKLVAHAWVGKGDSHHHLASKLQESIKQEKERKEEQEDKQEQEEEQEDLSLKAYRRAVECLDRLTLDSDGISGKGHVLSKMMRYKEALDSYEKAIKNTSYWPDDLAKILRAKAMVGEGNALFEIGKYDEALKCYEKAIQNYECKPCLAGKLRARKKMGDETEKILSSAKEIIPDFEELPEDKGEQILEKTAKDRVFAEAWLDREIYLSLIRYSD
jgi:tetratricopeptide (TPR) repeat protein